jgi:aspartyl-tRNA(Asn)/glutamyl-tRNA(Gln) amidotransferase subunit C
MSLTDADVQHVATLARLGLSPDEIGNLRNELSSILEHIAVLQQIDTSSISPTAQANNLMNVMRDDVVGASLSQEQALANAPQRREGFFEVRAVLGEDEGATS